MTEEYKIYKPDELYFDAARDPMELGTDYDFVRVFLIDKEENVDYLGDHNVEGVPDYLLNQMENEWGADYNPEKSVEEVKANIIAAGFEYKKLITWY